MGYSLGSVLSLLALNVDPLIDFGILGIGACELSGLIWDNVITIHLKKRLLDLGIDREDLQKAWSIADSKVLKINIEPDKVLMFSTRYDEVLRPKYQDMLWNILNRPKRIWLPSGHYSSFLFFNKLVNESVKFIQSKI